LLRCRHYYAIAAIIDDAITWCRILILMSDYITPTPRHCRRWQRHFRHCRAVDTFIYADTYYLRDFQIEKDIYWGVIRWCDLLLRVFTIETCDAMANMMSRYEFAEMFDGEILLRHDVTWFLFFTITISLFLPEGDAAHVDYQSLMTGASRRWWFHITVIFEMPPISFRWYFSSTRLMSSPRMMSLLEKSAFFDAFFQVFELPRSCGEELAAFAPLEEYHALYIVDTPPFHVFIFDRLVVRYCYFIFSLISAIAPFIYRDSLLTDNTPFLCLSLWAGAVGQWKEGAAAGEEKKERRQSAAADIVLLHITRAVHACFPAADINIIIYQCRYFNHNIMIRFSSTVILSEPSRPLHYFSHVFLTPFNKHYRDIMVMKRVAYVLPLILLFSTYYFIFHWPNMPL